MNLLLLNYNNYFNRQLKKTNLEGYYALKPKIVPWQGEFNHNDGVNTSVVLLTNNISYDYLVVVDDSNNIVSRWFIYDTARVSKGKYRCELKRDLMADFYLQIVDADCFVEKGYVSESNPLIYNKEDFSCNDIKTREALIQDATKMSWIALYYNVSKKNELVGTDIALEEKESIAIGTTLEAWDLYVKYGENHYIKPALDSKGFSIICDETLTAVEFEVPFDYKLNRKKKYNSIQDNDTQLVCNSTASTGSDKIWNIINGVQTPVKNALQEIDEPEYNLDSLLTWNGKIIKTSDNKFYRISIRKINKTHISKKVNDGTLFNAISSGFIVGGQFVDSTFSGNMTDSIKLEYDADVYSFVPVLLTNYSRTISFDFSQCRDLEDEPYGLILLPYKNSDEDYEVAFNYDIIEARSSLAIFRELTKAGVGSDKVIFDAQILPYCPFDLFSQTLVNYLNIDPNGGIHNKHTYESIVEDSDFVKIKDSNNTLATVALFPRKAQFTKYIDFRTVEVVDLGASISEVKVDNQCVYYRMYSPNYCGSYDFSASKNGGIDNIRIDCAYKPYNPYIHVSPIWKNLYGEDFGDTRGLVCTGDFSMSVVSNNFENYKLNNANYQKIFDREITSMDKSHQIQKDASVTNIAISTGKGIAGGAIAGTNPATIALGAATGLASGIVNAQSNDKTYAENRDKSVDLHNYQLENIKCTPDSLNKVDSINPNNKIFPIIEQHSCTEEEKEIFRNKLKYEGMTVNAVGKISQYLNPNGEETFIKAKPLRILGISEDSHMLYSIYEELEKGYYFTEVTE